MALQFMTPEEARNAMNLADALHQGKIELPAAIVAKKKEIEAARRKAEQFIVRLGRVDHGMVNDVVRLMFEKDNLYVEWAKGNLS